MNSLSCNKQISKFSQQSRVVSRNTPFLKKIQKSQSLIVKSQGGPPSGQEPAQDIQKIASDLVNKVSSSLDGVVEVVPESIPKNYAKGGIVAVVALIALYVFQKILPLVILLAIGGVGFYVYTQYNKAAGEQVDESVDEARKQMDKWKS